MWFKNKKNLENYDVPFNNYHVVVTLKNGTPIYQKYFEGEKEINHVDSIIKDSMFSYQKNKLVAKGKWKIAENKKIIHIGLTKLSYTDTIYLVEFSNYDPINDINIIKSEKIINVK